jgi:hypothetical protein
MAVSIGIAAFSAASATATASFVGFWAAFATNLALGVALRALTPKPPKSGANRGYQINAKGSALDHQIIYGKMRVGGVIVYDEATGNNNKYLHRIIAYAGHEIQEFNEIYINDEVITLDGSGNVTSPSRYNGFIRINKHLGTSGQAADSDLVSESTKWTLEHKLSGLAYLYIRLKFDADVFPNGVPNITTTIKGKKVYDPRDSSTAWSDNPALCIRDYLTSNYGLAENVANVDDALVITAANICDQTNTLASTTRYTCNGAFVTSITPLDFLNDIITSFGGMLWYSQGKWRMKPAYFTSVQLALTDDDLRSNIKISTRHSRRDNFNKVKGTFRGAESNWQVTDYPAITNTAFLLADNNQDSTIDFDLPFTDNSIEARRIALIALERNRQQITVNASFGMRAFKVQVGDTISLTNVRFGWTAKTFEVVSWNFGLRDELDLQIEITLREISSSVFDEVSDGVVYENDNTNLLSPFDVPSVGVSAEAVARVLSEKLVNQLEVTITAGAAERIDLVEVQYKADADTIYNSMGTGEIGKFIVVDLARGLYDIRARAINTFGIKGDWEYLPNFTVDALSDPPQNVTNFAFELSSGTLFLSWLAVTDLDLSYYKIRHYPQTSNGTWGNSQTVIEKVARPGTSATLPARSGMYFIKAFDKGLNESVSAVALTIQPVELPPLGALTTLTENPSFGGGKTNVVVDTTPNPDELIISTITGANPAGTYTFTNYVDTTSSRTARITGVTTFNRHQPNAGTWDTILQNWDTWPNNFDNWSDEQAAFNDTSVEVFVAATPDNPASSPTWGAWSLANGADVVGRAFKFKAELSSINTGVSPSITILQAKVEY